MYSRRGRVDFSAELNIMGELILHPVTELIFLYILDKKNLYNHNYNQ